MINSKIEDNLPDTPQMKTWAGQSYQIHTTVDDELEDKYVVVYEKNGRDDYPFSLSSTGLLTMPCIDDAVFSEQSWFVSSIYIRLRKVGSTRNLAYKYFIFTCYIINSFI